MELVLLIEKHELLTNSIIKEAIMHKETHQRWGWAIKDLTKNIQFLQTINF